MLLSEFDYHLPDELIAQEPLADRAGSRMLVVHRPTGMLEDRLFRDLPHYLGRGDCLVLNNSKVFPARLFGKKIGYERPVELFLLNPLTPDRLTWRVLARPGRHVRPGMRVFVSPRLFADIAEAGERGERTAVFRPVGTIDDELEAAGHVPLPPYIHRADEPVDRERYQTVYAEKTGSAAAPTAGLHFTEEMLDACRAAGAIIARVTLHVGLGTFQPLAHSEVESNRLHTEAYEIMARDADLIRNAKRRVAVGTTSVRTMETLTRNNGMHAGRGETDIFIYPGFEFQATDALLTNFHLPRSSLLLLVAAFGGRDLILNAYQHAAEQGYRFFSYGDSMLIL